MPCEGKFHSSRKEYMFWIIDEFTVSCIASLVAIGAFLQTFLSSPSSKHHGGILYTHSAELGLFVTSFGKIERTEVISSQKLLKPAHDCCRCNNKCLCQDGISVSLRILRVYVESSLLPCKALKTHNLCVCSLGTHLLPKKFCLSLLPQYNLL